jgi:hypothetical protein
MEDWTRHLIRQMGFACLISLLAIGLARCRSMLEIAIATAAEKLEQSD